MGFFVGVLVVVWGFLAKMFIGQAYAVEMILQWRVAFWYLAQKYVLCLHLIVLNLQETGLYLYGPSVAHKDAAAINQRNGDITEGRERCMQHFSWPLCRRVKSRV